MATTIPTITVPSQPYRLDWTAAESLEAANAALAHLWEDADKSIQTLFDNLKTAINSVNTAIAAINALNQPTTQGSVIIIRGHDGEDGRPGPPGLAGSSASSTSSLYDPGTTTLATASYMVMAKHLILTGSERFTLVGTSHLAIVT